MSRAVIEPGPQRLSGTIVAQPSKNYTTRWLLAAALADGRSIVRNAATSDDARALISALRRLGAGIRILNPEADAWDIEVEGVAGRPRVIGEGPVDVGNAGAVLRLLLGVGALTQQVTFSTQYHDSLGRRPNDELLAALAALGCSVESRGGCLPVTLRGGNLRGGRIEVSGARSSQFISSLLFLAPLIGEPLEIVVADRLVSRAPVQQTLEVLARAGVVVEAATDLMRFAAKPGRYAPGEYQVNGDWPGSAAILAAAAVTGSTISMTGLIEDNQGERAAARVLREMGARIELEPPSPACPAGRVTIEGRPLQAVDFDGDTATDAVLALEGAACFARGRSRFHNVANLRIKECDRISEPLRELKKVGVVCGEGRETGDPDPDAIWIEGRPDGYDGGVEVDGCGDHRVIMLETIVGLGSRRGLVISGAEAVAKSYPAFFRHLLALGARISLDRSDHGDAG
ncbi:MAG: 3-phosphoshikimate 1-carboxyvinyltransferase [Candidatus Sumerlaeaceae bacterium]|nr:3-phosphoshikimate 1-carboxyvinyltransferase [Candidatus Sumerlaeaceae bacterium]